MCNVIFIYGGNNCEKALGNLIGLILYSRTLCGLWLKELYILDPIRNFQVIPSHSKPQLFIQISSYFMTFFHLEPSMCKKSSVYIDCRINFWERPVILIEWQKYLGSYWVTFLPNFKKFSKFGGIYTFCIKHVFWHW